MNDLIDRRAALDVIRAMQTYKLYEGDDILLIDKAVAQTELMLLPSVQPDIIRCKDCKFWTYIKTHKKHWCKTDDGLYDLNPSADDFCSRAERRSNGHN